MKSFSIVCLSVFLGTLLNIFLVNADSNPLLSVTGGKVRTSHVNQYFQALSQNVVPRNSSGIATDEAGSLGTSTFEWKNANIVTGYWQAGDIKCHHTFNGLLPVAQGWMLMDGRIINLANYDAEHAAGNWVTYIGSSPIDGRFLPDMNNKYIIGVGTTAQDGTAPITSIGNTSHEINLEHLHPTPAIKWYVDQGTLTTDTSFDVNGNPLTFTIDTTSLDKFGIAAGRCSIITTVLGGGSGCIDGDYFTNDSNTTNALSATQSIRPESKEFVCFMRII